MACLEEGVISVCVLLGLSNLDMIFKIPLSREGLILLLLFPQTLNTRFRVLGEVAEHDQHEQA